MTMIDRDREAWRRKKTSFQQSLICSSSSVLSLLYSFPTIPTMLLSRIARLPKSPSLFCNTSIPIHRRLRSALSYDPLRILFCGSDHFSATSLKALFEEYAARTGIIESIDVLCKEDKRAGRGLRTLKEGMLHSIITPHSLSQESNFLPFTN